ncbi:MAG: hypothetical protein M3122_08040 [Actinomycetota bacterium]|nr:hypothetical protein [Actinomycetota bacterium]
MNVFFDVQGTLLDGGVPRPQGREVFIRLAASGHDVYLWSSAGADYAASAADLLVVQDLILGCHSKFAPPPVTVDYAVDDSPDIVESYGGYTITSFDGDPENRELWRVVEALKQVTGST